MSATILCVDDEPDLLEILTFELTRAGFSVLTAPSAERALALLSQRNVDLILSDLRMPLMSGVELLQEVRSRNLDLPLALMTAFPQDVADDTVAALRIGAIFPKPYRSAALVETLRKLLGST